MSKLKSTYYCQECGAQYSKWQGQCNKCNSWNSISEELIETSKKNLWDHTKSDLSSSSSVPKSIENIKIKDEYRIKTKDNEFNRVLGGGIVPGSITLLGGEPGIGKSTLFLQISLMINQRVLYVSGEESENQIKIRANRISYTNKDCLIYAENKLENIFSQAEKIKPNLIIIDSIQTLITNSVDSLQGSITQLKTCTAELINFGKKTSIPVMLIGHINKDGNIAGPKVLEHMVDTVLQFEGDRNHVYRILRTIKNRFGSASELGVYEMSGNGLRQVTNPSEILITERDENTSGVAIAGTIEGARPLLVEIQSLVSSAVYGTPQRSTTGFDTRRMNMLLAVLEKGVALG